MELAWRCCTCDAFPQSVHAVILDGVTYPEQAIGPDTPQDGEHALELIVTRCAESPDCAKAYPDLRKDLDGLRREFGPGKRLLTIDDPNSGQPLKVEFNRSMLNASLRFLSYSSAQHHCFPHLYIEERRDHSSHWPRKPS